MSLRNEKLKTSVLVIDTTNYENIYLSVNISKDKEELEITPYELESFKKALNDEAFKKMLSDHAEKVRKPQNQITFQSELCELEREKGKTVHFISPIGDYVLKTSINGKTKGFINICSNHLIRKTSFIETDQNNSKGSIFWSVPYCQSSGREDVDKEGQKCMVYDIIYNPEAIFLAKRNQKLKKKLEQSALDAVELNFSVKLDKENVKRPKLRYKGLRNILTVKYNIGENAPYVIDPVQISNELTPEKDIQNNVQKYAPLLASSQMPLKLDNKGEGDFADWTEPKYTISYRSQSDAENYCHLLKKSDDSTNIVDELILTVDLPMLENSNGLKIDIISDGTAFELTSDQKALSHLKLNFAHAVHPESSKALFAQEHRKLLVKMPLKKPVSSSPIEDEVEKAIELTDKLSLIEEMTVSPELLSSSLSSDVGSLGSKKSVRFSDDIRKIIYKSNSSILGQRKKNQRKSNGKKKARERLNSVESLSSSVDEDDGFGGGIPIGGGMGRKRFNSGESMSSFDDECYEESHDLMTSAIEELTCDNM